MDIEKLPSVSSDAPNCCNPGTSQSNIEYFSHVDQCCALTEQVPGKSDFNSLEVSLTCFDISPDYFAFGSNCGALFIFNRRLNRSAAPLRTDTDEVVTCVKLLSAQVDLLAAGHSSGALTLLSFPSANPGSARKLEQALMLDGHRNHAVTSIAWAEDGKKVYSADDAGVVVATSVDFVQNQFQKTFVCFEHSSVLELTHTNNLLAICTARHIKVVDEISLSLVLEIDEHQKAQSIQMVTGSCGIELFILQSDGIMVTYDVSSGEKKRSLNLSDSIMQKYPSVNFQDDSRPEKRKSCILLLYPQFFVITCNDYILLLNFDYQPTVLSIFNMHDLSHNDESTVRYLCIDPRSSSPTIYILNSDNQVFRLSSEKAASYLTKAHDTSEELSAKNLLTYFKKTAKLLPYTSKDTLLGGLKMAKEIDVLSSLHSFPLPLFNSSVIGSRNTKDSLGYATNDYDGSDDYDNSINLKNHEYTRISAGNIFDSVSKVTRKLVDTVGGFGEQAKDGFIIQEPCNTDVMGVEESLHPVEQLGMVQEIVVRRTKSAPSNKHIAFAEQEEIDGRNLMSLNNEDLSPINEDALKNIREVLINPPHINETKSITHDDSHEHSVKKVACLSEKSQEITSYCELINDANIVEEQISATEQFGSEEQMGSKDLVGLEEGNAYEFLMKNVMERKALAVERATSTVIHRPDPEQLIKGIALVNNFGDHWNELNLPYSCLSFSVSSKYIVVCHSKNRKKPRYLSIPYCGTPHWMTIKQKADHIVLNDDDTLVWKIYKNVACAPIEIDRRTHSFVAASQWTPVACEGGGIVEVALTKNSAWYLTKSGEVYIQLRLPEMGILSRCETLWPLHSITASDVAVWALQVQSGRLVIRAGLKHSPVGLDWVEIVPYGPERLISISLFGQSGWAIDEKRSLWFTNGVGLESPFGSSGSWMKVYNPWDFAPDISRLRLLPWIIRVSSAGVFVCVDQKCFWASGTSLLSGHRLEHIVPDKIAADDNFDFIVGGSLNDENVDFLTLCRANEIFLYRLKSGYFYSLPASPASFVSDVIEITSFDSSVYILDSSGCIYIKENITSFSPYGTEWKLLDTGSCEAPVISFVVTSVSLWVVTSASEVYLYVRKETKEPLIGTKPSWIHVKTLSDSIVEKVRASSNGANVWIFSKNTGRAWARSSISDVCPSGKSWVEASDELGIRELAVGCRVIWSLSGSGLLYRLQGLAFGNPAGNYWKSIPLYLQTITVDRKDRLWGIDMDKRLVLHRVEIYPPSSDYDSNDSMKRDIFDSEKPDEYVCF